MQELLGRIAALDPDASLGIRVIACFDELILGVALDATPGIPGGEILSAQLRVARLLDEAGAEVPQLGDQLTGEGQLRAGTRPSGRNTRTIAIST